MQQQCPYCFVFYYGSHFCANGVGRSGTVISPDLNVAPWYVIEIQSLSRENGRLEEELRKYREVEESKS